MMHATIIFLIDGFSGKYGRCGIMADSVKKTVLVVDDEILIAMGTATILRSYGIETVTAMSGVEAVNIAGERDDIDLVLMDIDLGGGMDGTEAAEIILRGRDIPLVFLSSHTEREVVEKTEGITSYGYVVKNSGETVLMASIKMAFRLHEARMMVVNHQRELNALNMDLQSSIRDLEETVEELRRSRKELIAKERALRESEERFRFALRDSSIVVFNQDRDLRYTWIYNPKPAFNSVDIVGKRDEDLLPPEESSVLSRIKKRVLDSGKGAREEVRTTIKGYTSHYDLHIDPILDEDCSVAGIRCVSVDITEMKQAAEALRSSEERMRFAMETGDIGAWDFDLADHTARRTLQHDRIFGYDEMLPYWTYEMFLDHVVPEDRKDVDIKFKRAVETGRDWSFECRIRRVDGDIRWIWAAGRHQFDEKDVARRMSGIVQDITERRRSESELHFSRRIVENMAEGVMLARADDGVIVFASEKYEAMFGYGPGELVGSHVSMLNAGGGVDPVEMANVITRSLEANGVWSGEVLNRRKDGGIFWCVAHISVMNSMEHGKVWISVQEDITERKKAEEKSRESEERYRTLFNSTTQGVVYQVPDGSIIDANPAAERILGLTLDQMRGRTSMDPRWKALRKDGSVFPGNEHPSMVALGTGEPVLGVLMGVYNPVSESNRWILVDAVPLFRGDERKPYISYTTFSDITERVEHEEEVLRLSAEVIMSQEKERERIAGELHDSVGQTLSAANLNIRAYQLDPGKNGSRLEKGLKFIEQAIGELREVYSHLYPTVLRDLGLETAIKWLAKNLLVDNGIKVRMKCGSCDCLGKDEKINLYRIFQEVFSNILQHSEAEEVNVDIELENSKETLSIEISDNGRGFLLKRPGNSRRGMGLLNIKQRVDQMGGTLIISSMPGRGTRLNIECGVSDK